MNNLHIGPSKNFTFRPSSYHRNNNIPVSQSVFGIFDKKQYGGRLADQGICKWFKSGDISIFGPYLWSSFHIMAANYPDKPTSEVREGAINFIKGIPFMIPCGNCGYHFKDYLENDYLPNLNKNIPLKLKIITSSKDNIIKFFIDAHNNVTKNTNKKGKIWTFDEVKDLYSEAYRCLPKDIKHWEDATIKKSRDSVCKTYINSHRDGVKRCYEYKSK